MSKNLLLKTTTKRNNLNFNRSRTLTKNFVFDFVSKHKLENLFYEVNRSAKMLKLKTNRQHILIRNYNYNYYMWKRQIIIIIVAISLF